jgi:hypothetical protein
MLELPPQTQGLVVAVVDTQEVPTVLARPEVQVLWLSPGERD